MIHFIRFDHLLLSIPLGASPAARAFYGGVLRQPELPGPHPSGALWYQVGDVQLHLREDAAAFPARATKQHPAFEVANLPQVQAWLREQGVPLEEASPIAGRQRFFFRDPFGNRLELLQFAGGQPSA